MKVMVNRLFLLISLLLLLVFPTYGAEADVIDVTLSVQKVEMPGGGKEVFTGAETVRPGDVLQYQIVYKIMGKDEVLELFAQLPIPEGMEYITVSAQPPKVQASVDGKEFLPIPLQRQIKAGNGQELVEEIPTMEYRFLGWPMRGLAPGDEVIVSARFRVNFITDQRKEK